MILFIILIECVKLFLSQKSAVNADLLSKCLASNQPTLKHQSLHPPERYVKCFFEKYNRIILRQKKIYKTTHPLYSGWKRYCGGARRWPLCCQLCAIWIGCSHRQCHVSRCRHSWISLPIHGIFLFTFFHNFFLPTIGHLLWFHEKDALRWRGNGNIRDEGD